jgi:uncharacterized protein YdhG (YjbR/CyaY superfamily)
MAKKRPATIKDYIEAALPEARSHLHQLYRILKSIAPDGTEAIKWGVPVFWERRILFGFAAYKAHISFGPGPAALKRFSIVLTWKIIHTPVEKRWTVLIRATVTMPAANPKTLAKERLRPLRTKIFCRRLEYS